MAIGGRRTRGSVFRIRATGLDANPNIEPEADSLLDHVLRDDQPLASWSRAGWVPAAQSLNKPAFLAAALDAQRPVNDRVRAIEILVELFAGLDRGTARQLARSNEPSVRARTAWALSRGSAPSEADKLADDSPSEIVARLTSDPDPAVARAAWEALAMMPVPQSDSAAEPDWARGLTHPEHRVRAAAVQLARGSGAASYHVFLSRLRIDAANWPLRLAQLWIQLPDTGRDAETPPFAPGDMLMCCRALAELAGEPTGQLEAVRLLEIALGDVRVKEGRR